MPDPITLAASANALATIVQLLGIFTQERANAKELSHREFVEWLQYHKHEQLVQLICNQAAIRTEVDNLLRQDHAQILAKLDAISGAVTTLLSRTQAVGPLALAVAPNSALSDQAIFALRQLVNSSSRYLIFGEISGGCIFQLEHGDVLQYYNGRFLKDDLETLASFGLLAHEPSGDAYTHLYRITRAGAAFVATLTPDRPAETPPTATSGIDIASNLPPAISG